MNSTILESQEQSTLPKMTDKDLENTLMKCAEYIQKSMHHNNEIEKVFNRTFLIDSSDINQIFEVVNQRIRNDIEKIEFISFSLTVASSNENFRKYNAIEDFLNDVETRDITPINLQLDWNLLIKFNDSEHSAKQSISIIITRPDYENVEDPSNTDFLLVIKNRPIIGNGAIIVSIENTNKIWALDILSHIENWINRNVRKPSVEEKYKSLYKHREIIRLLSKLIIDLFPYFLYFYICLRLISKSTLKPINDIQLYYLLLFIGIIYIYNFFIKKYSIRISNNISSILTDLMPQSAFIFSKEDNSKYSDYLRQIDKRAQTLRNSILIPILINLISSTIFIIFLENFLRSFLNT